MIESANLVFRRSLFILLVLFTCNLLHADITSCSSTVHTCTPVSAPGSCPLYIVCNKNIDPPTSGRAGEVIYECSDGSFYFCWECCGII